MLQSVQGVMTIKKKIYTYIYIYNVDYIYIYVYSLH